MIVKTKTYNEPPICENEILRYAGCKDLPDVKELVNSCIKEAKSVLTYKVCYAHMPVKISAGVCDFGHFTVKSQGLFKNLKTSESVVVFAATVGIGIDRLIAKYGRISPARALIFQAIGAERCEALCDMLCNDLKEEFKDSISSRFSPGYQDLSLDVQKNIFEILNCQKHIGLFLNDSLLMSPSKSVTAFVGIGGCEKEDNKCKTCNKTDCEFRGVL